MPDFTELLGFGDPLPQVSVSHALEDISFCHRLPPSSLMVSKPMLAQTESEERADPPGAMANVGPEISDRMKWDAGAR